MSLKRVVQRWWNTVLISTEQNLYNAFHYCKAVPAKIIPKTFGIIFPSTLHEYMSPIFMLEAKWPLIPTETEYKLSYVQINGFGSKSESQTGEHPVLFCWGTCIQFLHLFSYILFPAGFMLYAYGVPTLVVSLHQYLLLLQHKETEESST